MIRKPFDGDYPITFKFGEHPDWYTRVYGYPHNGVDFGMPEGVEIKACSDGVVSYADSIPDADGLGINIRHGQEMSQYWHLKLLCAKWGQSVKRGDVIGISGSTGFATGPHLHFGYLQPSQSIYGMRGWVDPLPLFDEEIPELPSVSSEVKTYRVLPGDSLWKIAAKIYGDGNQWVRIYNANKDKIKHPALIYPLQLLIIP